jgi:hypothetical protein
MLGPRIRNIKKSVHNCDHYSRVLRHMKASRFKLTRLLKVGAYYHENIANLGIGNKSVPKEG